MTKTLVITLGLLAASMPLLAAGPPPFYWADGERIELEVIPELLTVGRSSTGDGTEELVAALDLQGTETEVRSLTPGVLVVDLRPVADGASRRAELDAPGTPQTSGPKTLLEKEETATRVSEEGIRLQQEVIDLALTDPSTEWAYPALRNPRTGTVLFVTPQIIVGVRGGIDETRLLSLLPQSLRLVRPLRTPNHYLLELTNPRLGDPLEVAANLVEEQDWVQWAEPNFIQQWKRQFTPNDPLFPEQWHLNNTGQGGGMVGADGRLPDAWDVETGDGTVVIGVLDDGVEIGHPDLPIFTNPGEVADGLDNDGNGFVDDLQGWDFFSGDNDPNPCTSATCSAGVGSHGTSVAGVAAATGNNSTGGTGSCQNCQILPLRIVNHATGVFTNSANIADAIDYAADMADILNNSWGGGSPSTAITTAIQNANASGRGGLGSPVFFSTGNSASGYIFPFTLLDIPAGTWTFTWTFSKDGSVTAGLDSAWLDNVILPDGTIQTFEGCGALPTGWSTSGNASWMVVNDETRANSLFGGRCAIRAGTISHNQSTAVAVTKTFASGGDLQFAQWVSAERNTGTGPIIIDNQMGSPECFDFVQLTAFNGSTTFGPFFPTCGTFSNQGNPLQDGAISYPASLTEAIAVGATTNFDTRSDYSQWHTNALDFLCHSNGGTLGITTTDLTGTDGYDPSDYTDAFAASGFGGTSSAAPLCAGIAALILSHDPSRASGAVRTLMQNSTRKIGSVPYSGGRNALYGFGAVSAKLALEAIVPGGGIVVEKRTIPGDDLTTFTFSGDLAGSISDGQQLSSNVAAGSYSSTETVPTGWSPFQIACDDSDSTGNLGTATATFQVATNETVTCVFTNCSDAASSTLDLSGMTVTAGQTETFEACDTITAGNFMVEDTASVTLRAGSTIILEDGVEIGGYLTAVIVGAP